MFFPRVESLQGKKCVAFPYLIQRYSLVWDEDFPPLWWLKGGRGGYLEFPSAAERFLILGWSLQISPQDEGELRAWLEALQSRTLEYGEGNEWPLRLFGVFSFSSPFSVRARLSSRFGLPLLVWSEAQGKRWVTLYRPIGEGEVPLSAETLRECLECIRWRGMDAISERDLCARLEWGTLSRQLSWSDLEPGYQASVLEGYAGEEFNAVERWEPSPSLFPRLYAWHESGRLSAFLRPSSAAWERQIALLKGAMRRGEVQKVVLARTLQMNIQGRWQVEPMLETLRRRYPYANAFFFRFSDEMTFLGATPERLARLEDDRLETMALAGSLPRGKDAQEDALLTQKLLQDARLSKEHQVVVDHICRQLNPMMRTMQVSERRPLLLPNVQHLQVHIWGKLTNGYDVLDAVKALHPTAALGGEPRQAALEWIARLEPFERGWYGAPFGWVDAQGNGDFYVALRCGLIRSNQAVLYAGAGILAESDPQAEWEETALKFHPMLQALEESLEP
ncbi:MAG: isochorismate synthase MenF [Anaerolineales bacterium]